MIKIIAEFKDQKKISNLIRFIRDDKFYFEAQEKVFELANNTAEHMKQVIESERKNPARPDHALENSITAETLSTVGGIEVGIGNIAKMNAEARYWELINDGGTYVTKKTHVVPTTYFADPGTGFVTFKEGSSHTIDGIDYVGKAIRRMDEELREAMKEWGEKFFGELNREAM